MEKFIQSLVESINNSNNQKTRRKLRVIKSFLGVSRLKQSRIDDLNELLRKSDIIADPELYAGISDETNITFRFNGLVNNTINESKEVIEESNVIQRADDSIKPSLKIADDFFKYLFDFGSDQEYERFQASLDSNAPMAIFLIPKKDNFYSSILHRILSFEVIRKRQYQGQGARIGNINPREFTSKNENILDGIIPEENSFNTWTSSDIHSFSHEIMDEVILGLAGQELIHSKDFNNRLNQLALYSNKYYSNDQFFVLFDCPCVEKISQHEKTFELLGLIEKVTQSLPNTFKLTCKFENDAELAENSLVRQHIIDHFKVLFEIPQYIGPKTEGNISNVFTEFQKVQSQAESQLLHNIDPTIFTSLKWGGESHEHIYLKYFAIKTLHKYYGYSLELITSENNEHFKDENANIDYNSRPDVKAEHSEFGNIIVEAETMRGKSYLLMIGEIIQKAKGWQKDKKLIELWLVVPGFEVARNYYQLQTFQKITSVELHKIFGKEIKIKVFAPDYLKQEIIEVNLSRIQKQTFEVESTSNSDALELEKAIAKEDYEQASILRNKMLGRKDI